MEVINNPPTGVSRSGEDLEPFQKSFIKMIDRLEEIIRNIWREYDTDEWGDKYFTVEEDDFKELKQLIQQLKEELERIEPFLKHLPKDAKIRYLNKTSDKQMSHHVTTDVTPKSPITIISAEPVTEEMIKEL